MKSDYVNFTLNCKVMSPLFIGSGESINKLDYLLDKNDVVFIDKRKLVKYFKEIECLNEFNKFLLQNDKASLKEFFDILIKRGTVNKIEYSLIEKSRAKYYKNKISKTNLNEIDLFIKDFNNNPYIPGSSLKGAFRTVLESCILNKSNKALNDFKVNPKAVKNYLLKEDDLQIMSGVMISDSNKIQKDSIQVLQREDYSYKKRTSNTISNFKEFIKEGSMFSFSVTLDKAKTNLLYEKYGISLKSKEDFLNILKDGFELYLNALKIGNKEEQFLPNYNNNNALFVVGGMVGYHSKSILKGAYEGDELIEKTKEAIHKKARNPKMKKISEHINDKNYSPRTLKVVTNEKGTMLCGIVEVLE